MEFDKLIGNRRNVYGFLHAAVRKEKVLRILEDPTHV
jgi:hypothetical protein